MAEAGPEPHLVKRYDPERLYDTTALSYVGVAQLRALAGRGVPVTVIDARSGEDVTGSYLRGGT